MDGEMVMRGFIEGGKAAATAIPAAVATDLAIERMPRVDTYAEKTAARLAAGVLLTGLALLAGAPIPYAVGPMVGNTAVAGVEASRFYGLGARLRNMTSGANGANNGQG
ncbi:MAG: hypothetical protein U0324_46325 [Polyangiales bacterium]